MKRTDEEFCAEVMRRSKTYIRRRNRRRAFLGVTVPALCCAVTFSAVWLHGRSQNSSKGNIDILAKDYAAECTVDGNSQHTIPDRQAELLTGSVMQTVSVPMLEEALGLKALPATLCGLEYSDTIQHGNAYAVTYGEKSGRELTVTLRVDSADTVGTKGEYTSGAQIEIHAAGMDAEITGNGLGADALRDAAGILREYLQSASETLPNQ